MRLVFLVMGLALHGHSADMSLKERFGQAIRHLSKGSDYNPKEGRRLLVLNGELGHAESMFRLSELCLHGEGGPLDYQQGIDLLERLARRGIALAHFELGQCYQQGLGVEKDQDKADSHFKTAFEKDPDLAKRHRLTKEAQSFQKIKNPLHDILQEARHERSKGNTESSQRALKKYQDYIIFADNHGFVKDPQALVEYARLLIFFASNDNKARAMLYLNQAWSSGHEEAAVELVKLHIKENTQPSHEAAQTILFTLPRQKKTDRLLALSYLAYPWSLDERRASAIKTGLRALHEEGNIHAVKELFWWSIRPTPGMVSDHEQARAWLEILHKKNQHQLIAELALALEAQKNFPLAFSCFMHLTAAHTPDAIKRLAYRHLAFGLINYSYTPPDAASEALWLKEAFDSRGQDYAPKLSDQELASALTEVSVKLFHADRSSIDTVLSLLDSAITLNHLNAARLKFDFLLTTERISEAWSCLDSFIPRKKQQNFQTLLYEGKLPPDAINHNLGKMALLASQFTRPDKPNGDATLYGHYLSYASLSGKKRAVVNLGTHLLFGSFGFQQHVDLGLQYLHAVPTTSKYYPDACVILGKYYRDKHELDKAFDAYRRLGQAKKSIKIEILGQLSNASSIFDETERWPQTEALLHLLIALAKKYNLDNDGVRFAHYNLAYLYYNKKPGLAPKEPLEILALADQSSLPEGLILRALIMLDKKQYAESLTALENAKKRMHEKNEFSTFHLLMFGYTHAMLGNIKKASQFFAQTCQKRSLAGFFNQAILELLSDTKSLKNFTIVFKEKKEAYESLFTDKVVLDPFFFVQLKKLTYEEVALKIRDRATITKTDGTIILIQELKPLITYSMLCLKRAEEATKNLSAEHTIRDNIAKAKAILDPLNTDKNL